jgi:hypothetical protein
MREIGGGSVQDAISACGALTVVHHSSIQREVLSVCRTLYHLILSNRPHPDLYFHAILFSPTISTVETQTGKQTDRHANKQTYLKEYAARHPPQQNTLHNTTLNHTRLHHTTPQDTTPHHTTPHHTTPHHTTPLCSAMHHTTQTCIPRVCGPLSHPSCYNAH